MQADIQTYGKYYKLTVYATHRNDLLKKHAETFIHAHNYIYSDTEDSANQREILNNNDICMYHQLHLNPVYVGFSLFYCCLLTLLLLPPYF